MIPKPNRLSAEASPYLRQHAYNPVDWYPWGPEALEKARRENKPILLSVGYSACHWCHVMERESFEDGEVAELMNRHFVSVKVDREERPDLDHLYQLAAQMLTGQGGWPLTVFLTPDLRPFFAGTYFPPEDRYGRPGFKRVLRSLAEIYGEDPERVQRAAGRLTDALQDVHQVQAASEVGGEEVLQAAAAELERSYDRAHGGFGTQPKFPNPFHLELFLRLARRTGRQAYAAMACHTLRQMARGGIYDQLGGGFHRYSVDAAWRVPHFEKMLYDNALLPPVYLAAYQCNGEELFARIARETVEYVLRELTDPAGGFYSTQDADSEGEEGRFFVWRPEEVAEAAGDELAPLLCEHLGVTPAGNFEGGRTVLSVAREPDALAAAHGLPPEEVRALLAEGRRRMAAYRERRERPLRDEKILTGWNGLMITACARAARILGEPRFAAAARRAWEFIRERLHTPGGQLLRVYKDGPREIPAYLEDHVFLAAGLVDLYEATFDDELLAAAQRLAKDALERFWDDRGGGLFMTAEGHGPLIHRPKDLWDQSVPSGNGYGALTFLRLHALTGEALFYERAQAILRAYRTHMEKNAWGSASFLCALDGYLEGFTEVVVAAPGLRSGGHQQARELLHRLARLYLPNAVLAGYDPQAPPTRPSVLLEGKGSPAGQATVYVCRNFTCERPAVRWEEIEPLLTVRA